MATTRDPYGYDNSPVLTAPVAESLTGTGGIGGLGGGTFTPAGAMIRPQSHSTIDNPVVAAATTAADTPRLPGSPLNTLYGVDSESYLTDEQRKLARSIQGQFDASSNRRDRELARWGAARLASDTEDEALARAMSLARGLNFPTDALTATTDTSTPGGIRYAGGRDVPDSQPYRPPTVTTPADRSQTGAQTNAEWQRILSGLSSIAPLLFGKDAWGNFLNKGLFGSIKDALFGKGASATMSDEQLEKLLDSQGANNSWDILPPAYPSPTTWSAGDLIDQGGTYTDPGWSDWYGGGPGTDWSSWGAGWDAESGGDILDLFGGV